MPWRSDSWGGRCVKVVTEVTVVTVVTVLTVVTVVIVVTVVTVMTEVTVVTKTIPPLFVFVASSSFSSLVFGLLVGPSVGWSDTFVKK